MGSSGTNCRKGRTAAALAAALGCSVFAPAAATAQPSPASVSLSSPAKGTLKLTVTFGESTADYTDLDLTTSPHPMGYYQLSNVDGPVEPSTGQQDCQVLRSSLNCRTGVNVPNGFSVTFNSTPPYPDHSVNDIVIGYPDDWSESITFCGPGGDQVLTRDVYDHSTLVSSQKTGASCPQIGVAGVRFAARSQTRPGTPGLPVIWDRPGQLTTEQENAGSLSCKSLGLNPADWDYLDCTTPVPQGTPQQNWPVVEAAGRTLTLDDVALYSPTHLDNAKLEATLTVAGATLTLAQTGVSETAAGDGYKLEASGPLDFSGQLPDSAVGRQNLQIEWKLTTDAGPVSATSSSVVYVTPDEYKAPTAGTAGAVLTHDDGPYLSVVDLGTTAAAGASSPAARLKAIWSRFQSRSIPEVMLDPATGNVTTTGKNFTYYGNDFSSEVDLWNRYDTCPSFVGFLEHPDDGHCGDWAWFLEQVLAYQGIATEHIRIGAAPGFDPGPPPFGFPAAGRDFMLVGPWRFARRELGSKLDGVLENPFEFANRIAPAGGKLVTSGDSLVYNPGHQPIAQGPVSLPLGIFHTGDHEIVRVPDGGGYFDPSYGQPDAGSSGFASIGDWEKASVSGFAVLLIGKRAGGGQGRVYTPAPYYDLPALLRLCARYRCLLAATPFGTGFLPSAGPLELLNNLLGPPVPAEPVACPADGADCAVQIAVKTGGHAAAAAAARSEIVGRRAVLIRHGTRRTVTAPLNATGRALLRRLHRLPVTVVVTAGRRVIGGGSLVIAAR